MDPEQVLLITIPSKVIFHLLFVGLTQAATVVVVVVVVDV